MYEKLLLPDLKLTLEENDERAMREFCEVLFPPVTAEILAEVTPAEAWRVLSQCELPRRAEIFGYLPLSNQVSLVNEMDRQSLSRLIEAMAADDRVDLLERLDPAQVESLLPLIAQAERADIRKLLSYPEHSAGSIMTTEYATLKKNMTVGEAIEKLRLQAPNRETIYYVYVIDDQRRLLGFVSLRNLILSKPSQPLADAMQEEVISVRVDDDQEEVAQALNRFGFIAMPVVDPENRLVGIVTHDDAAYVMQEEAEEDQQRFAAVEPLEDSYLSTPILTLARKRGVWLFFLLGAAVLTAWVLQFFEGGEGNDQSWIIMFLPLVLASGGNAGSQSAALVISALAREQNRFAGSRAWNVIFRELSLGGLLGGSVAFVSFFCAWALLGTVSPAIVVSATVLVVVVMAAVTGAALPILIRLLNADPAFMSTPLIAALVDVIGVIIYFNMAYLVFGHYPH